MKNSINPLTWVELGSISRRRSDQLRFVLRKTIKCFSSDDTHGLYD